MTTSAAISQDAVTGASDHPELALLDHEPRGVVLDLADMVGDENGEVVLFNDSGLRALELSAEAKMVAQGVVQASHVTSGGDDVAGFKFMSFENGTTIYYQDGFDLILSSGA